MSAVEVLLTARSVIIITKSPQRTNDCFNSNNFFSILKTTRLITVNFKRPLREVSSSQSSEPMRRAVHMRINRQYSLILKDGGQGQGRPLQPKTLGIAIKTRLNITV